MPPLGALKKLTKSLAMLDAILMPEWDYRYYSFNSKWSPDEEMASMRDGQGDEWFCLFTKAGAALKGFDHESIMSPWGNEAHVVWPGVLDQVPDEFTSFLKEPAFSMADTTFCIWRRFEDAEWRSGAVAYPDGEDPDGSGWMLPILDGNPSSYKEWAEGYYERSVDLASIAKVYGHQPLNSELVHKLNPERDRESLKGDALEIAYPTEF